MLDFFLYIYFIIITLCVGSFLNVVIARLPQSASILKPGSHCPKCTTPIRFRDNIPILSYLYLQGRCFSCKHPISLRYPLIEMSTAVLSILVLLNFGIEEKTFYALFLTWTLLALSLIDFEHLLLPDLITLPLLWVGLFISIFNIFANSQNAILGAILGYGSLWLVYWAFKLLTKKEGMGYGDFKLLAALGAWFGWQALPFIVLFASSSAAIVGLSLIIFKKHERNTPIPFGPFLAAGGWLVLMFGNILTL